MNIKPTYQQTVGQNLPPAPLPLPLSQESLRVNLCRINFSHTNHDDALNIIYLVNKINKEIGSRAAILGDLQGPKLRIGLVKKNTILKNNSKKAYQSEQ